MHLPLYVSHCTHLLKITEIVRVWNDNGIETAGLLSGGMKCLALALRQLFFVYLSKLPTFWHVSKISIDGKCLKFIRTLIFMMENRTLSIIFLFNSPIFEKTESKWAFESVEQKFSLANLTKMKKLKFFTYYAAWSIAYCTR